MDPVDFISLAGKLAATANADEAVYRTAVSRAYYGDGKGDILLFLKSRMSLFIPPKSVSAVPPEAYAAGRLSTLKTDGHGTKSR